MLKSPAATVKQLAGTSRFLVSERRAPVPEPLQRQPVRLAIFPLIQVTTPPASKCARQNDSSSVRLPAVILGTINLLLHILSRGEKIAPREPETSVQRPDAYHEFPVPPRKFPDTPIKFPVPIPREFVANLLI